MNPIPLATRQEIVGVLPPPPGVSPDFEHPESIGYRLVIVTAIFLPLASVVVALRIYTRRVIVHAIGYDDYAIILGWLLSIALSIACIVHLYYGLGVHMWDVPVTTFSPPFWIVALIGGVFYGVSFMFVKMSLLLLYLRLSQYQTFRIMVYAAIITTVTYSLLGSFEFLFGCRPIAKSWDITITYGSCINPAKILAIHGGLNIATDIAMLVLPVVMVRKLQLPRREKVALAGLFMTGTLVCIISIIRLKKVLILISASDTTWLASDVLTWSTIEVNVGIICACLPSFKPFLRRHFPRALGNKNPS
ncbi:hypothetical protein B0J14DRAFT_675210 [Halenospora varia]|nr:hypothetical protein B0J14DRAFT_658306 [Halenospora varia]KAH6668451.1 hypothetical protein B0J14DRAFT_675210 [Halenospora varia]